MGVLSRVLDQLRALEDARGPAAARDGLSAIYGGTLREIGVPGVEVPFSRFWAPRCGPGDPRVEELVALDAERWLREWTPFGEPWYEDGIAPQLVDPERFDRLMASWRRVRDQQPAPRVRKRPSRPLIAAYARDVHRLPAWGTGRVLRLQGADRGRHVDSPDRTERFKTLPAIVRQGRATAAALGAWPWASHEDGALPEQWWRDDETLAALARFVEASGARLQPSYTTGWAIAVGW